MAENNPVISSNATPAEPILDFVRHHFEDEWNRLAGEFSTLDYSAFTFQPGPMLHSIGWHVRHVIEWRYALVHVLISGKKNEENLTCLGWENEPLIQSLTCIRAWNEPSYTVDETLRFARNVREITDADLLSLPVTRYRETIAFPWRTNRLLDEIFQDVRHSAVHRGQIREIKKVYARGLVDNWRSDLPDLMEVESGTVSIVRALP